MLNALTIDVEDYFQVNAFAKVVSRASWDSYPLRVGENTRRILALLDEFDFRGTFFVLGWVAEKMPDLVRAIHRSGHEIGCHGYGHELIYEIGPQRFKEDIVKAKTILEDLTGEPVRGYRAPSYSITDKSFWALDILVEAGFIYDSSIFPVYHDTYGLPNTPRFPYLLACDSGTILEFPLTTYPVRFGRLEYRLPIAGGGYLRLMPASLLHKCIVSINTTDQQPVVLYFHPWEIDPEQPRIKAGIKSTFRHYLNLETTEVKLRNLLGSIKFTTMWQVLKDQDHHECNVSFRQ